MRPGSSSRHRDHLRSPLTERLISFRTMTPSLRRVSVIACAELVVAALIIGLREVIQIPSPTVEAGLRVVAPAAFAVSAVLLVSGLIYIVAALLHAHALPRFLGLLALIAALGLFVLNVPLAFLVSVPLLVLAATASLRRAASGQYPPELRWHLFIGSAVWVIGVVVLAGLLVRLGGLTPNLLLGTVLLGISFGLMPALVLAGADYAELLDAASVGLTRLVNRLLHPWASLVLASMVATAILVAMANQASWGILLRLAAGTLAAILVLLLVRFARLHEVTVQTLRRPVLALGALATVAVLAALDTPLGPYLVVALAAAGVALVAAGRVARRQNLLLAGIVLLTAGILNGLTDISLAVEYLRLGRLNVLGLIGMQATAAGLTLGYLIWAAVRGVRADTAAVVMPFLLALNIGLLGLGILSNVFTQAAHASAFPPLQALLWLGAIAWEVAISGESITNGADRFFPRSSRVLIFFGYTLLIGSCVLFFSAAASGQRPLFDEESWAPFGLVVLGTAVLVTLFALRVAPLGPRLAGLHQAAATGALTGAQGADTAPRPRSAR